MDILVSLCNISVPGLPALGLLDTATSAFRILQLPRDLPPNRLSQRAGIHGLAVSTRYVYAVLQKDPSPSELLVLARKDLRLLNRYVFQASNVHSLCVSGEVLNIVSTGTDEVIELRMRGSEVISETVFWRPDPEAPRADIHHLNAICAWRGDLLVSGFGKKPGQDWSLTRDGFIVNVTRGEKFASGIYHPHSLMTIGDAITYCESGNRTVRVIGRGQTQRLPGYTRGLCLAGQKLFVGTSVGRRVSKSTGMLYNPQHSSGAPAGRCTICRLSASTLEIEDIVDLSDYGYEIYDLLTVEGTSGWPFVQDYNSCSPEATWWDQVHLAMQEIATLIPPGDDFIWVDQEMFGGVAVDGRRAIPFPRRDEQYQGPPSDDITAIRELDRLRRSGASFIVFGWFSFWWLSHYAGLHEHLRSKFRCVMENERLVAFDLRP
jgi:Domain of unknown function (DUF4915)